MERPEHILVVEDDEDIQQLVTYNLVRAGYRVTCVTHGRQALELLKTEKPGLVLLDLMLPGYDGLELCRILRNGIETRSIPVIMLTAKGEEEDIVRGLECGADDYIVKPFSPKVLLARIKAVTRRKREELLQPADGKSAEIVIHNLRIDPGRHEAHLNGIPLSLTLSEFNILRFLAAHPGRVYSRQQIIDEIRGYDFMITDRAIDVQIFGLRKKMGEAGANIETVRGIGYRFRE